MASLINKKSDFCYNPLPPLLEESPFSCEMRSFRESLNSIKIPGLNTFQFLIFEKRFEAALNEETFLEKRERFQDLIGSRLKTLSKSIAPSYIQELHFLLLKAFDDAFNKREPIFQIVDRWLDTEMISPEIAEELSDLIKLNLFNSSYENPSQLKIEKSLFSNRLLSIKEHALLQDDHIALFSKVFKAIVSMPCVGKGEEFDSFLDEFLLCLEKRNREIKEFHINRLKNSLVLQERACTGQLLDSLAERKETQGTFILPALIEHCSATPKCVITSARYWYTRVFDELRQARDPFSCFLDYLFDQNCVSFKTAVQLWSAALDVNRVWNEGMHAATKQSRLEHQIEALQYHIGPRFDKIPLPDNFPLSQNMMTKLFANFLLSSCPNYIACFIRLIKENVQELGLNEEESVQLFKGYFDFGSSADHEFLYNLCESTPSLEALFRFDSYYNEYPENLIPIFSKLNQKQIYYLAKGYIDGGPEELQLRLSKLSINGERAEKFIKLFEI